ncbi:MAG: CatB-related O-acetyltransferase [Lachnospiraceae bacterium]|nr:CatB-related O-acetyltransferase [Lachnospiraceae bacterium]
MVSLDCELGKKIYIGRDCDIRSNVKIGDYSKISAGSILFNDVKIGRFSSIGYNCQIGCPEHPVNFFSTSPRIYADSKAKKYSNWKDFFEPPVIGNDVWVGSNVIILQGCKIGDGAIIAAGAVVTKNVEPFTIWGGVPAKMIKKRFDSVTEKKILDTSWWEKDIDEIERIIKHFYDK